MKLLIFSDSHGDVDIMCGVVEKEHPDMIIHLGDSIADAEQLNNKYPDIQMIKNLGNIDSQKQKEDEKWIQYTEICGKRFMMTHGHTFALASDEATIDDQGRKNMLQMMFKNNIDILLHGHIHEPYIWCCQMTPSRNGWIMCPGRIGRKVNHFGTFNPIYGVLKISESGVLEWQFTEVGGNVHQRKPKRNQL